MLPNISKSDLGDPTEPGHYPYQGAEVMVEGRHLATWAEDPSASFRSILCNRVGDTAVRLALGDVSPRE